MSPKKLISILAAFLLTLSVSGCVNNEPSETTIAPITENSAQVSLEPNEALEEQFIASLPDATIVDSVYADIDNDNQVDYIAIFEYPQKNNYISKSSVGVAFSNGAFKAVDLASDKKNYIFADNTECLKILANSNVQVLLYNSETDQTIRYEVTFSKSENGFDIKISADEYFET